MEELDTFDDGDYTEGPMDEIQEEDLSTDDEGSSFAEIEGQDSKEETVQNDTTEEIDTDSQVSLLDETEETRGKEGEKEKEEKSDKPDEDDKESDEKDDESDKEDDAGESTGDAAEDVRTVKAFADGKAYEVPEDATIKTKVAGKWEKPTLQELKDNYAGKVAYDRKFSELGDKTKTFEQKETQYNQEIDTIKNHFVEIRKLTEQGMAGEADPAASMNYLLDLMGINTVDYNKAVFDHMSEQFDAYNDMTESEREAHWTKKENAYLVKKQESLTTRQSEEKSQAELSQKVTSLRETHSVSEEDYVSAEEDLKALGQEITPEKVIQAAKLTPLLEQADSLLEKYAEQLDDNELKEYSVELAKTMYETPELTLDQVKTFLAEQFEVQDIVSTLEKKVGKQKTIESKTSPKDDTLDLFED